MNDSRTAWNGTIRESLFTYFHQRPGQQLGIRPGYLLAGVEQVCKLRGLEPRATSAGVHYGVNCKILVIEYEKWEIHLVTEDNKDIPMPIGPEERLDTPVLPAVFFLCVFTGENWPEGINLERAIARLRLLLVGHGRARGLQLPPNGNGCLQLDLHVVLGPQFEDLPR